MKTLLIFFAALLPAACNCTTMGVPALTVSLVDAATGQPIISGEGMVVATSGDAFADTIRFSSGRRPGSTVGLALEKDGVYVLEVAMDGYATWIKEDIRVESGACHVETEAVTVRLQRID